MLRTAVTVLLIAAALGLGFGQAEQQFAQDKRKAPELVEVTEWLNTKPLTLAKLKGRVVVLHFFTYG